MSVEGDNGLGGGRTGAFLPSYLTDTYGVIGAFEGHLNNRP